MASLKFVSDRRGTVRTIWCCLVWQSSSIRVFLHSKTTGFLCTLYHSSNHGNPWMQNLARYLSFLKKPLWDQVFFCTKWKQFGSAALFSSSPDHITVPPHLHFSWMTERIGTNALLANLTATVIHPFRLIWNVILWDLEKALGRKHILGEEKYLHKKESSTHYDKQSVVKQLVKYIASTITLQKSE